MPRILSQKSLPDAARKGALVGLLVLLVVGVVCFRWQAHRIGVHGSRSALAAPSKGRGSALSPIIAARSVQAKEAAHAASVNAAAGVRPATSRASLVPAIQAPISSKKPRARAAQAPAPEAHADQIEVSAPDEGIELVHPKASQYTYDPQDRRDPFQSLLKGEFEYTRNDEGQPLVDVGELRLLGVAAANNQYYAMVEDSKKHGFTLRVGDPVLNGRVTQIQPDCITVNLSSYGETQMVKLHLTAIPTNTNTSKRK